MELSVIVVSHNVKAYLEHCLRAIDAASRKVRPEVIVVDNASEDGTAEWLPTAFPAVRFLPQASNLGFAKGCNVGLEASAGDYVLFLNPDTLLPENCLEECLGLMQARPQAGALGVRMIDGLGNFLRESKRAFPSPLVSLFKMIGMADLFPGHRTFARYHMGHLDDRAGGEVPVLAGAFMLVRGPLARSLKGFDERFFMYGEDIDFSTRVVHSGYVNYYYAGITIIHFKGQSSGSSGRVYRKHFYGAMRLFLRKYYSGPLRAPFRMIMDLGVTLYECRARLRGRKRRKAHSDRLVIFGSRRDVRAFRERHALLRMTCEEQYREEGPLVLKEPAWVLFCLGDLSAGEAITWLDSRGGNQPCFFHHRGGETIIGPDRGWGNLH